MITIAGEALGKADRGRGRARRHRRRPWPRPAEAHPEFEGKTIAAVWDVAGAFYVYTGADPRVEFLADLGFEVAPSVEELDTGESTFYYTLSYEETDKLDLRRAGARYPTRRRRRTRSSTADADAGDAAVREAGTIAPIVGTELVASVSPPTALSLTYGLDELVASLSAAVQAGS